MVNINCHLQKIWGYPGERALANQNWIFEQIASAYTCEGFID